MPDSSRYLQLQQIYQKELFEYVLPFWLNNSLDWKNGGYYCCLTRDGRIYETDKFAWMLGRELWTMSKMYNVYGRSSMYLDAARLGAEFIQKYAFTADNDVYFSFTEYGDPLVHPYNIFSECFICVGLAEYYRASQEEWAKEKAISVYRRIQERKKNPKGIWTKQISGKRAYSPLNMTMIEFMMFRELQGIVPDAELHAILNYNIDHFFSVHVDYPNRRVLERPLPDGRHDFSHMEGRLMTPGHTLETMWFLLDILISLGDDVHAHQITDIMLDTINFGWDEQLGGIPLYKDALNLPTEKLESNQRQWWVHAEALCSMLLAFKYTKNPVFWSWFTKIHEYTFSHFPDHEFGEWYGYLDRHGEPEFTVKGSKFKTAYHLPRALMQCDLWLGELLQEQPSDSI